MLKFGIIGYPLKHTLSPVMHMAALEYLNIGGEYLAYEVKENKFEKVFNDLKEKKINGFNVTIPYKKKIIPLIDELSENARLIDAVNTVTIQKNGKTFGDNTDIIGFWDAIPGNIREKIPEKEVAILGCGGAASACAIALIKQNIKSIKLYGRDKAKVLRFRDFLNTRQESIVNGKAKINIEADLLTAINLTNIFMLINTTPTGMFPNPDASPVIKMELKKLAEDAVVYDIIYNPPETQLLKLAKSLEKQTINGVEMLVRQGAASLAIWLKQEVAPLGAMRLAVNSSLDVTEPSPVES